MKLEAGSWILIESMIINRIGYPRRVIKVSGKRVYWELPRYNKDGSLDYNEPGFCMLKSVKFVVPSEAAGVAIYKEQQRLDEILNAEHGEADKKFYNSRASYALRCGAEIFRSE